VKAEDSDSVQRWQSISDWYAEFAAMPHCEFLAPMVGLTAWVAEQPFAAGLFPCTSHERLWVELHTGYDPDQPHLSCGVCGDGQFECALWAGVGRNRGKWVVPFGQARETLAALVGRLYGLAADAEPGAAADGGGMSAFPGS
jgi:hypothetical protein